MKKLIFTLMFLTAGFASMAYPALSSELELRVNGHYDYSVRIEDQVVEAHYGSARITNLHAGAIYFEVFRSYESWSYYGRETVYERLFSGRVNLRPGEIVIAEIDYAKRFRVLERRRKHITHNHHSTADIGKLRHVLANTSFDNTRLKIALEFARYNELSSRDVAFIMRAFTFESTKYKFAKHAFRYVYDPGNYYIVLEEFTYDSTKRKLLREIRG